MSEKYFDLTMGQGIMRYSQKFAPKKSIVDICSMLSFDCEINKQLLVQALTLAMLRNESSHVRLCKVGKELKQYLADDSIVPITFMDYSASTDAALNKDIEKWSTTPFPNGSLETRLYSIRLILKPNGFYALYFCVSHLAFDAFALMQVVSDILNIYVALRDGKAIPKQKGDYRKMCEEEAEYKKSEKYQKTVEYWVNGPYSTEPTAALSEPEKMKRNKKRHNLTQCIDLFDCSAFQDNYTIKAELVEKVNALAEKLHVSAQCIYFLALRSYLSRLNDGQEDISMCNAIARRSTLLQKNSGGTRVLAIPFRMNFSNELSVREGLDELNRLQHDYYAHADVLLSDIAPLICEKYKFSQLLTYSTMTLTYNPYTVTIPDGIKIHMNVYSNGASAQPCYISIMALDNSGDLNCNYECMKPFTTTKTPGRIHEHLLAALEKIVADPEMKIKELNNL